MTPWRRGHLAALGIVAPALFAAPVLAADQDMLSKGRTAVARQAAEWNRDGKPVKLNFDFGNFKAWMRRDGSWNAEGSVQHHGLLCGTYTLLLRVGHGNPACANVQWFSEQRAVGNVRLCNNARGTLSGGDTRFPDAARFDEITCADRAIACDGNCQ